MRLATSACTVFPRVVAAVEDVVTSALVSPAKFAAYAVEACTAAACDACTAAACDACTAAACDARCIAEEARTLACDAC